MIARCQTGVFSLSRQLAAAGRYAEALQTLAAVPAEELTWEMKSLRAKILSQQGDFAQAVEAWREIVDQAPEDANSRQGLELAERLLRRGRRSAFPRVGATVAAVLLLAAGFGFWVSYAWGHQAGAAAAMAQESVRDAQTERLQTASSLVQELQTMIQRDAQEDAEAAQSLQTWFKTLEQRLATVGQTLESSCQDSSAVAAIEGLRRDLAATLRLAKEVRVLSDRYERLAFRRGYVSEEEHRRMRQELGRLCDQSDALLERVAALVWSR